MGIVKDLVGDKNEARAEFINPKDERAELFLKLHDEQSDSKTKKALEVASQIFFGKSVRNLKVARGE